MDAMFLDIRFTVVMLPLEGPDEKGESMAVCMG